MANEWAKHNININAIAPGYMATDNTEALRKDDERSKEILKRNPPGQMGAPRKTWADPACFWLPKRPAYMNGFTMAVDGGWLAR